MTIDNLIMHLKDLEATHELKEKEFQRKAYGEQIPERRLIYLDGEEAHRDRHLQAKHNLWILELIRQTNTAIDQAEQSRARLEKRIKALEDKSNNSGGSCTGCHCG